jgi:hypothetical protein
MNKVEGSMHLTSYNYKIDGNKLKKIKNLTKLYPNEIRAGKKTWLDLSSSYHHC